MNSTEPDTLPQVSAVSGGATPVAVIAPVGVAKYRLPPIHREGHPFVAIAAGLVVLLGPILGFEALAWLMAGLTLWVAAFFRDPERVTPVADGLIVSPADGMVCSVADVSAPRQLTGEYGIGSGPFRRVSIFMNVFDVHVNRSPVAGIVRRITYVPGKFLNADLDKASDDNERQYFIVEQADGTRIGFTQIAGLVARRIVRFSSEGDQVLAGERVGLIRFGSRVDVYLPAGYGVTVLPGQRTTAGETVLGRRDVPMTRAGLAD